MSKGDISSVVGFEVRLCVRVPEDPVRVAREVVRRSNRYDNLSHYVRAAIIRLNNLHLSGGLSDNIDLLANEKEGADKNEF